MSASQWPAIAQDGLSLTFESTVANLAPESTGIRSVYVRDLPRGKLSVTSVNAAGEPADDACEYGALSADGRFVAFTLAARNLVPGDAFGLLDVFLASSLRRADVFAMELDVYTCYMVPTSSRGSLHFRALLPSGRKRPTSGPVFYAVFGCAGSGRMV